MGIAVAAAAAWQHFAGRIYLGQSVTKVCHGAKLFNDACVDLAIREPAGKLGCVQVRVNGGRPIRVADGIPAGTIGNAAGRVKAAVWRCTGGQTSSPLRRLVEHPRPPGKAVCKPAPRPRAGHRNQVARPRGAHGIHHHLRRGRVCAIKRAVVVGLGLVQDPKEHVRQVSVAGGNDTPPVGGCGRRPAVGSAGRPGLGGVGQRPTVPQGNLLRRRGGGSTSECG